MRFLFAFMLFVMVLTGCNNSADPVPVPTEVVIMEVVTTTPLPPTETVPSTETPVPEPTATVRPSRTPTPTSGTADGGSMNPVISRDGRFIVFESSAYNISVTTPIRQCSSSLDQGRVLPCHHIYLYDRERDELTMISVKSNNLPANGNSYVPVISDDGRYIAYMSDSTNLDSSEVVCDLNGQWFSCPNIYVYDRTTRTTLWVSRPVSGERPTGVLNISPSSLVPSISGDGRYIAYMSRATNLVESDENSMADIFVFDQESSVTRRVSTSSTGEPGNGPSYDPIISGNGSVVLFASLSNNLVPDDTNNAVDIFAHDLETGETTRVSVASDGTEADSYSETPSISYDGRYVTFESAATTLDPTDRNLVCDLDGDGDASENCIDVFLHDRETGTTTLISLSANGRQNFESSLSGQISSDGQIVAFANRGSGMVPDDGNDAYDLFVRDVATNSTVRVSVASDGTEGDHQSGITDNPYALRPTFSLSEDGRYIVFGSSSSNFVEGDFNNNEECEPPLDVRNFARFCSDIFLHDRETGETILLSYPRKNR